LKGSNLINDLTPENRDNRGCFSNIQGSRGSKQRHIKEGLHASLRFKDLMDS